MIFHAEDPKRAAGAIAALACARESIGPGGIWTVGQVARILPRGNVAPSGVARLLFRVEVSVEQVIGIACTHGFHAEELGRSGLMEFWIDEHLSIELVTPEAVIRPALAA